MTRKMTDEEIKKVSGGTEDQDLQSNVGASGGGKVNRDPDPKHTD